MIFLGFDTSNYTTSVGAVYEGGYKNIRSVLPVAEGERGIRQSDGVFLHTKNIAKLFNELDIDMRDVKAVGVSSRPRNAEGSYMPVFLVGDTFGKGIAKALNVPVYEFSHQDGHIMAGIYSANAYKLLDGEFLSVHISGGTTEILRTSFCGGSFKHEIVGGTTDISAGQYIDRIGVRLGMKFPCGAQLEETAKLSKEIIPFPLSVKGGYMSFSGVETKAAALIGKERADDIAYSVLANVSKMIVKSINNIIKETGIRRVLIVGGVASNSLIREDFEKRIDAAVYFAARELSSDNAVGTAEMAKRNWR